MAIKIENFLMKQNFIEYLLYLDFKVLIIKYCMDFILIFGSIYKTTFEISTNLEIKIDMLFPMLLYSVSILISSIGNIFVGVFNIKKYNINLKF